MTLATCKKRLELASSDEEKQFWEKRIARKLSKEKYVNLRKKPEAKPKAEPKKEEEEDGKKPKG